MKRTPIRRVSKKQARINREWSKLSRQSIDNVNGMCCIRIPGICAGRAEGCHHFKPRGRGGSNKTRRIPACEPCHRFCHDNPKWAAENGLMESGKYG